MNRWIAAALALVVAGGTAWWISSEGETASTRVREPDDGVMTDAEREAYVKEFVRAVDVKVGADTKPESDEAVPGLLRVTGKVINEGDETIDRVVMVVFPKDAKGEVIAMDQQDVIIDAPLEPDEIREFRFQIRDRPEFSGAFDHEVR